MYGAAVFGFPLLAAGASPITNYNVLLLGGMFLSALSAWALARYVTGDALSSLVAGVVYGFLPYKISQLPHVHMEWGAFLCLVFLFLLRYLDHGRASRCRSAGSGVRVERHRVHPVRVLHRVPRRDRARVGADPERSRPQAAHSGRARGDGRRDDRVPAVRDPVQEGVRPVRDATEHRRDDVLLGAPVLLSLRRRAEPVLGPRHVAVSRVRGRLLPGRPRGRARGHRRAPAAADEPGRGGFRGGASVPASASRLESSRGEADGRRRRPAPRGGRRGGSHAPPSRRPAVARRRRARAGLSDPGGRRPPVPRAARPRPVSEPRRLPPEARAWTGASCCFSPSRPSESWSPWAGTLPTIDSCSRPSAPCSGRSASRPAASCSSRSPSPCSRPGASRS